MNDYATIQLKTASGLTAYELQLVPGNNYFTLPPLREEGLSAQIFLHLEPREDWQARAELAERKLDLIQSAGGWVDTLGRAWLGGMIGRWSHGHSLGAEQEA